MEFVSRIFVAVDRIVGSWTGAWATADTEMVIMGAEYDP